MTDLGTFGGSTSDAVAINQSGQVTGWADLPTRLNRHAFLWQRGILNDLGTLGGRQSVATAINDVGQVVGFSQGSDFIQHAFVWDHGAMVELPGEFPGEFGTAVAINNSGRIVGNLTTGFQTGIIQYVAVWDRRALTVLSDGTPEASALAVSDGGKVVGYDKTPVDFAGIEARLWTRSFDS